LKPNIILLTVDALRKDRTSLHDYQRQTTPSLSRLAKNAIVCNNNSSLAAFTQGSFPSILTGTRPLSFGGYDEGGAARPGTAFEFYSARGYFTACISSLWWSSRFFGYGNALDYESLLFPPQRLIGPAVARIRDHIELYSSGGMTDDEIVKIVQPVLKTLCSNIQNFCDERQKYAAVDAKSLSSSILISPGMDYDSVRRLIHRHELELSADPLKYIERYFHKIPESHEWLGKDIMYCVDPYSRLKYSVNRVYAELMSYISPNYANILKNKVKPYVDAEGLAGRMIQFLSSVDKSKPFFLTGHFMDTHKPYFPGEGSKWWKNTPKYLSRLGYSSSMPPAVSSVKFPKSEQEWQGFSELYDAAVLYVDEHIGRIVDALSELNLLENTIIVVSGDHGEELGEHGNVGHYFRLYEHNTRTPLMFYNPKFQNTQIDNLTSLCDILPTLANLTGYGVEPFWEGASVDSIEAQNRKAIVMETFYGGNCDFKNRPIYMAARSKTHKLIWKEYLDQDDRFSVSGCELYDLNVDPMEENNIYEPNLSVVKELAEYICERLKEIPEVSDERRLHAFYCMTTGEI